MQTIKNGVESLGVLAWLNMDRILVLGLTSVSLFAAGYLFSV